MAGTSSDLVWLCLSWFGLDKHPWFGLPTIAMVWFGYDCLPWFGLDNHPWFGLATLAIVWFGYACHGLVYLALPCLGLVWLCLHGLV